MSTGTLFLTRQAQQRTVHYPRKTSEDLEWEAHDRIPDEKGFSKSSIFEDLRDTWTDRAACMKCHSVNIKNLHIRHKTPSMSTRDLHQWGHQHMQSKEVCQILACCNAESNIYMHKQCWNTREKNTHIARRGTQYSDKSAPPLLQMSALTTANSRAYRPDSQPATNPNLRMTCIHK